MWAPHGRSLFVLAADGLYRYAADGGDASRWAAPQRVYGRSGIVSAAWVGDDRLAVLVADAPDARPHVRLLARRADGRFARVKDFPALTGHELAATGRHLILRRGSDATGDGALDLLDLERARPKIRTLTTGANPAWAG